MLHCWKTMKLKKPRIICFTKIDALTEEQKKKLDKIKFKKADVPVIKISSVSGENLNKLKDLIWEKLHTDED